MELQVTCCLLQLCHLNLINFASQPTLCFCYCYEDNTSRFLSIMKMFRVNKIQKISLTIKFMFCLSNILCKFYFKKITKICQISTWRTKLIKIFQSNFLINFLFITEHYMKISTITCRRIDMNHTYLSGARSNLLI